MKALPVVNTMLLVLLAVLVAIFFWNQDKEIKQIRSTQFYENRLALDYLRLHDLCLRRLLSNDVRQSIIDSEWSSELMRIGLMNPPHRVTDSAP